MTLRALLASPCRGLRSWRERLFLLPMHFARGATVLLAVSACIGCDLGRSAQPPSSAPRSSGPTGVVALAAGAAHTCALRAGGTVVCWGSNEVGQIGVEAAGIAWSPREVLAVRDAVQIGAAAGVTCVRRAGGAVRCWGATRKAHPLSANDDIAGLEGARDLAVGPDRITVLLSDGSVVQKGLRDDAPVERVAGISSAIQVSAGYRHACALSREGRVQCWGRNDLGELGDGSTRASTAPVRVVDLDDVQRISTSQRGNCAWKRGGSVACWGNLGAGKPVKEPFAIPLVGGLVGAAGALGKACGWFANGTVDCVKRGTVGPDRSHVPNVHGVTQVVAGHAHFCALERMGRVLCWGSDEHGQLGDPDAVSSSPRRVPGIDDARDLIVARSYACVVRATGSVSCWGNHPFRTDEKSEPHVVSGLVASRLATNDFDACVIDRAGSVRCWGTGLAWAGLASIASTPSLLPGISGAQQLALGFDFACASTDGGRVRCAGKNRHGEIGDGTKVERRSATFVEGLEGAGDVATSDGLVCAVLNDGRVSCWGTIAMSDDAPAPPMFLPTNDDAYSLEPMVPNPAPFVDRAVASPLPTTLAGLDRVRRIERVGTDLCAIRRDGTAACWSRADRLTPRPIEGLEPVRALAGSRHHRCAVRDDQRVVCWGRNDFGEIGAKTIGVEALQPVVVAGCEGAEQIAAGEGFTCARLRDGAVQCWGSNRVGELGNGAFSDRFEPVEVPRSALRMMAVSGRPSNEAR